MTISTTGTGERNLYVSYISEVPIWKTTYRIVLASKADKKPLLQGWAIVDNTVGEDWDGGDDQGCRTDRKDVRADLFHQSRQQESILAVPVGGLAERSISLKGEPMLMDASVGRYRARLLREAGFWLSNPIVLLAPPSNGRPCSRAPISRPSGRYT